MNTLVHIHLHTDGQKHGGKFPENKYRERYEDRVANMFPTRSWVYWAPPLLFSFLGHGFFNTAYLVQKDNFDHGWKPWPKDLS